MTDLAELGLRIHSEEAELADRRLDSFEASAQRAETATDNLAAAARGLGNALLPTLTSIDASVRELLELQRIQQGVVGASVQQVAATQAVARETAEATAQISFYSASFRTVQDTMGGAAAAAKNWGAAVAQADSHVLAYRQHLEQLNKTLVQQDAHMVAYRGQIGRVGTGLKLTAQDGLNFSRQMADIGVTAAMGMSPLLIAVQQGPQLFDQLQQTAIRSSMSIRATMLATGAVVWTALAPLLPIIAGIGLAVGAVAGVVGLAARSMNKEFGDLTEGMGLTEEQLENVKNRGVTMGDVVVGTLKWIGSTIWEVIGPAVSKIGEWFSKAMDWAAGAVVKANKVIGGVFLGTFRGIQAVWRDLPAVIGDLAISAANAVIVAMEVMINKAAAMYNRFLPQIKGLMIATGNASGALNLQQMGVIDLGRINNPFEGQARASGRAFGEAFVAAMEEMSVYVDRTIQSLRDTIRETAEGRIRDEAGEPRAVRSGTGGSGRERAQREVQELEKFRRPQIQDLRAQMPKVDEVLPYREIADELRLIDQLARDAAQGMASAFGEAGRAMGDLLTVMTGYESRLAEIELAKREKRLTEAQAIREQAAAQIQSYGDMAAAARGFFREGSGGYQALLAVEQAYRAYQMAASIQAIAQGWIETSSSVAQSGTKGAASMAAGAAKMFEFLGPLGFPAVAAMLGLLAGLGLRGSGGSSGGSRGYSDDEGPDHSTNAVRSYTAQDAAAREQVTQSVAQAVRVQIEFNDPMFKARVQKEAVGATAPMVAAAAAGTKRDVFQTLNDRQVGNRKVSV